MPGDVIQVKHGVLYVNSQPAYVSPSSQIDYLIETNGTIFSYDFLKDTLQIDVDNADQIQADTSRKMYIMNLTPDKAALVKKQPFVKSISMYELNQADFGQTFPFDTTNFPWTRDNYGLYRYLKKANHNAYTKELCFI
jgi:signal peptidase I